MMLSTQGMVLGSRYRRGGCGPTARSGDPVVGNSAYDGRVAIGRQRSGKTLLGVSDCANANQLTPCWATTQLRCGCRPTRPHLLLSCRQAPLRWRCCRRRTSLRSGLVWLPQPRGCQPACCPAGSSTSAAAVDPRRTGICVVAKPTYDRGVPSADIATEKPCPAFPTAPVPISLLPSCFQTPSLRAKTHAAPAYESFKRTTHDGGIAVGGQCD